MNKKITSTSPELSGPNLKHYARVMQFLLLALGSVLYHAKCVLHELYAPFRRVVQRHSSVTKLQTVLLQAFQLKIGRILLPVDSRIIIQRFNHLPHRYNYDDNDAFNRQRFHLARLPFKVLMASFFAFTLWNPVVVNAQSYPEPTATRLSTISSLFVYANHNPL
jgi:hypothetical protein